MIKAEHIKKSYGNLNVLSDINLEVNRASIISIIGKSGAGKSTLLHILGTLDKADSGTLTIDGIDVSSFNEKKITKFRNEKIGFIFQFHHLLEEFTALENVCMPAWIQGMSKKNSESKAMELLDYLGLSQRIQHKPSELSGGEQQRVAIARALINRPAIVFADEPTGNLDQANSSDLHNLFLNLKNDFKQTFIIVTHNTELAELSDERYLMQNGILIKQD